MLGDFSVQKYHLFSYNVVKTIMNRPFGNGLYHHIPPIYGDLGGGLLLF